MLRDKVNAMSNGELTLNILGGPEVIPSLDQGLAIRRGVVDLAHAFASVYAGLVGVAQTELLSRMTYEQEVAAGYDKFLREEHAKSGIYYVGRAAMSADPLFSILVKKQIQRPQDLAGVKIGGIVASTFKPLLDELGAIFTLVPYPEAYVALDTGVVDGFADTSNSLAAVKLYEVKGLSLVDHPFYQNNVNFIMNPDSFNQLPAHLKDILARAHREVMAETPSVFAKTLQDNRKIILDAGVKPVKFTASDAAFFLDTAYDAGWKDQSKRVPADLVAKARGLLEGNK